jgi:hypothetical protein
MAQQAQQQLSNKDGALFRQVVRFFENKQYKKGTGLVLTCATSNLMSVQVSNQPNRFCGKLPTMPIPRP